MRLDKFISNTSEYSRVQVRKLIKQGRISVNGACDRKASDHILESDLVLLDEQPLAAPGPRYFMLHKPQGYVSANKDSQHPTALELLDELNKDKLQIVGRLDIDTTGLLLITDDGQWNHRITSPRSECDKTYYVTLSRDISADTAARFAEGIQLDSEKYPTRPAQLEQLYSNEARLTLQEGKYHQVKRMFAAVGNHVESLHRESIGAISLDPDLIEGDYRPLTEQEIASI